MIDSIQNLVQRNHGVLLYPHWSNSTDYKHTPESLGTVALHDERLVRKVNSINLAKPIKYTGELQFLCKAMGTRIPFTPVISYEEQNLCSRMIVRNKKNDVSSMIFQWCDNVDGKKIFPKLPVHLHTYYEKWERNN